MKTTMECNKCGYRWWVEAIGDIPPNPNCPRCFPIPAVTYTTGTYSEPIKHGVERPMPNTPKLLEELTRHEKLYHLLNSLTKKLGDTVWGSAAFDLEVSDARNKINSLIDAELATLKAQVRKEIEELKVDEYGENGNYRGCGEHNGSGECCRNETITNCLSIPSLKEASNE